MTIVIGRKTSKKIREYLDSKKDTRKKKTGNIAKHFGKLKRNIDGLKYQQSVRKDED